jgi:hypothetical protein
MTREQIFSRLGGALGEFEAARFCLSRVQMNIAAGTALHPTDSLTASDIRDCEKNLEKTYLLRLFGEFEFVLRNFLAAVRPSPRPRHTRMEHLIDRISVARSIPYDVRQGAHEVREYRNIIVHAADSTKSLALSDCKSRLARFLSYLPPNW